MSFSPTTCLSLIEKLPDQQINIEYHRLKNVTNTTINETTPTTPITTNKVNISHKIEIIRNSILNMMSSDFQRNYSLQAEIVLSLKSLEDVIRVQQRSNKGVIGGAIKNASNICNKGIIKGSHTELRTRGTSNMFSKFLYILLHLNPYYIHILSSNSYPKS